MDKKEAIRVIEESAQLYRANLLNRNILFIYQENGKYLYIEVLFLRTGFLHLTGVELFGNIKANGFFDKCLNKKLNDHDFEFKVDGTTRMKLEILPQLMCINKSAKMIGYYKGGKPALATERLAGGVCGCLAFVSSVESPGMFVPNSALKDDIRNISDKPIGVIKCILSKKINSSKYDWLEKFSDKNQEPDEKMIEIIINKVDLKKISAEFELPEFILELQKNSNE